MLALQHVRANCFLCWHLRWSPPRSIPLPAKEALLSPRWGLAYSGMRCGLEPRTCGQRSGPSPRALFNRTVQLRGKGMMHRAHQVELGNSDD